MDKNYTVGFDLDGCTVNMYKALCKHYLRESGRYLGPEDLVSYDITDLFNISQNKAWRMIEEVILNQECSPIKDAIESLTKLSEVSSLWCITAREKEKELSTFSWLSHFKVPECRVIFDKEKYKYAPSLSVMIEDSADQAIALAEAGCTVLLFDYPYNKEVQHEKIHRVYSWDDIVQWILEDIKH